jgi:predicted metal-dependent hydrolase
MLKPPVIRSLRDIEFKVIYSARRTIGISVHTDSSVIVRVPSMTSDKAIESIVSEKAAWIIKHRDNYRIHDNRQRNRSYITGETFLFRGTESVLKVQKSKRSFVRFNDSTIELGLEKTEDATAIRKLLYKGYKNEALAVFPGIMNEMVMRHQEQMFNPAGLIIRTMRRRWGSCSNKGIITLSTELVKLSDRHIEYVIIHELCHLRHHNHGAAFYKLLSHLLPEWKTVRKELRTIQISYS